MALAALASDSPHGRLWATIIQHRFGGSGALAGHPIGNLLLAGLNEVLADPVAALDELGRILGVKRAAFCRCAPSGCRSRPTSPAWRATRV